MQQLADRSATVAPQWLWRVFNLGWPRGHEDSTNEWGSWSIITDGDARRLAAHDPNKAYEFVPYVPGNPLGAPAILTPHREPEMNTTSPSCPPALVPEPSWRKSHRMRRGHPSLYCRECRGSGKSLTCHCVGRMLTDAEEAAIEANTLNFIDGQWVGQHPTRAGRGGGSGSSGNAAPPARSLRELIEELENAAITYGGSPLRAESASRAALKSARDAVDAAIDEQVRQIEARLRGDEPGKAGS